MDPNATLEEMLTLAAQINAAADIGDPTDSTDYQRLAELVDALHVWIVNGGALPTRWSRGLAGLDGAELRLHADVKQLHNLYPSDEEEGA